jgi:uncharacterized membrane protein YraQ (UPF0718 family)
MGQPHLGPENLPEQAIGRRREELSAGDQRRPVVGARRLSMLLVAVILVLIVVFFRALAPSSTAGIEGSARDFFTLSISVIIESMPFVFLGILISILVQIWLPEGFLLRRLPRNPVLRRMCLSVLGMLMPVCECGNVPMARGLMIKGLSVAESMTFLFAAPILNPVTIITTHQAFGWDNSILGARIAGGFLIANLIGWIFSRRRPQDLITPRFEAACAVDDQHEGSGGKLRRSVELFSRETSAMMPALVIGAGLAGLIQVAVSRNLLVSLGQDLIFSVLALMLLGFVVAICSTVDAFFILSFGSTFMPGAIVAFLVFGPMIDVRMLALLRTTFRARTLVQLTLLIAVCSAVLGWVINLAA